MTFKILFSNPRSQTEHTIQNREHTLQNQLISLIIGLILDTNSIFFN